MFEAFGMVSFYAVILAVIGLFVCLKSIILVGGTELAVVERRWLGQKMPQGRVVALADQVGVQARTLGPGLHFVTPFIYKCTKYNIFTIKEGQIGVVEAIDGKPIESGFIFAKRVSGHNLYQNGEAFLQNGGEKGPQIDVLPPGSYRINPFLFKVSIATATIINNNEVGVVSANDGEALEPGALLGKHIENHNHFQNGSAFLSKGGQRGPQIDILLPGTYRINPKLFNVNVSHTTVVPASQIGMVSAEAGESLPDNEFVAHAVQGHENFQNGAGFLMNGGQRGPQKDFLKPGTYYINPCLFTVTLRDELQVKRGEVAVIVSSIGKDPSAETKLTNDNLSVTDKAQGIERYVVEEGYRGIRKDVLGPGRYYLNLSAYTPYIIPTTNITIDWANNQASINDTMIDSEEAESSVESTLLSPLSIVSKDGFEMMVEVKVIIRILPEEAAQMLARIGTVKNLIENVIHPLIDSSFRNQASSTEAMQFLQHRHEEQCKAKNHVAAELEKYHVECVNVLICQIQLPDSLMNTLTSKVVASQQMAMYDAQEEAQGRRKEMERTKAQADMQPTLVKAELDVKIADQQKQQQIILAEAKSQSTRLEQEGIAAGVKSVGFAEAEKIAAVGEATAKAYDQQVSALGKDALSLIEVVQKIADAKIKITPDVLVQGAQAGAGGAHSVLDILSGLLAKNLNDRSTDS